MEAAEKVDFILPGKLGARTIPFKFLAIILQSKASSKINYYSQLNWMYKNDGITQSKSYLLQTLT